MNTYDNISHISRVLKKYIDQLFVVIRTTKVLFRNYEREKIGRDILTNLFSNGFSPLFHGLIVSPP